MTPYVDIRGDGPDLVLLHGWALHGGMWGPWIDELARHARLHLVDLPGHGRSPWPAGVRDLAEIRSLGVHPDCHGQGVGKAIGKALLEDAARLGVGRVFALTYATQFFQSLGFRVIDKNLLPRKVWSDCVNCHKFPLCDEVAMIKDFRPFPDGPVGPPPDLPQVIDLERLVPGLRIMKP